MLNNANYQTFSCLHLLQILIIQACQSHKKTLILGEFQHIDAKRGMPRQEQVITLRRPHTLLLCSTVQYGIALRGAFLCALSRTIIQADGKTDICQMFHQACQLMAAEYHGLNQTPELRSTLTYHLILPCAKMQVRCKKDIDGVKKEATPSKSRCAIL